MIGVYDSGFGGLSVLRALRRAMPQASFVYLGDSGRAPYGGRDTHTILDFAEQCVERLFDEGCGVVVVACHTVSCVGLRHLQRRYVDAASHGRRRILGVTIPAAEAAVATSRGHIGFLGTARTVESGTFPLEVAKLGRHRVTQRAAPLLAPIVEEGLETSEIARLASRRYLSDLDGCDTIVLGCTHYPLLADVLRAETDATVLDPSDVVAERLIAWFQRHPGFDPGCDGTLRVLCTGDADAFRRHGERFLGAAIPDVWAISESAGRLVPRSPTLTPRGQVVRER